MHTMTPWAERWEASIESELLLEGDDIEVEFDFANLMRGDAASRASYYQSGIQNGWLTRNEARIAENLNPLEGLDEPLRPLNMVEESNAEDVELDAEQTEDPAQEATEPSDEAVARLRALVDSSAERWARRIARAGRVEEKDLMLIAQSLAVPLEQVRDWAKKSTSLEEAKLYQSLKSLGMKQ